MSPGFSERLLLLKACIVRRAPKTAWITSQALMKALQEDYDLIRQKTPSYYFNDSRMNLSQELDAVVEEELITCTGKSGLKFQRTKLGDIFLQSLEPRLADILDEMPMSGEDILEFLSLL